MKTVKAIEEYRQGNIQAREKLILHYMYLAERIAENYKGLGIDDEDVLQAAYEGLILAIDECSRRERRNYNTLIENIITRTVKKSIVNQNFNLEGTTNNSPYDIVKLAILKIQREYLEGFSRLPSIDEICKRTNMLSSLVKAVLLEMDLAKKEYLEDMTQEELLNVAEGIVDPEFDIIEAEEPVNLNLPPRQKQLFNLIANGIVDTKTCAEALGISTQAVFILKSKAFKKVWASRDKSGENVTLKRECCEMEKSFINRRKRDRLQNRDRY